MLLLLVAFPNPPIIYCFSIYKHFIYSPIIVLGILYYSHLKNMAYNSYLWLYNKLLQNLIASIINIYNLIVSVGRNLHGLAECL